MASQAAGAVGGGREWPQLREHPARGGEARRGRRGRAGAADLPCVSQRCRVCLAGGGRSATHRRVRAVAHTCRCRRIPDAPVD